MFWLMLQVDSIQSFLNLKIGLPPVLKAGSFGNEIKGIKKILRDIEEQQIDSKRVFFGILIDS
jgi:hypothetical protein